MKKPMKKTAKHMDAAEDKKMIDKAIIAYAKKDKKEDAKMIKSAIKKPAKKVKK